MSMSVPRDAVTSTQSEESCCFSCGVQSTNLRKCSRCQVASYCSKECQRGHWKGHKQFCDLVKMNPSSESGSLHQIEITNDAQANSKNIRKAKKSGSEIVTVGMTAFGPVGPMFRVPAGVPPNFALLQQAELDLKTGPPSRPGSRGNLKYENSYRMYYDDLVENKSIWLTFFDHPYHYEFAGDTCAILRFLAAIYERRGTLKDCKEVLDIAEEVMTRCRRSSNSGHTERISACDKLDYWINVVRYGLCYQLQRYKECASLFGDLAGYESKYKVDFENQNFLFMLDRVLNRLPTGETLRSLNDSDVMKIVLADAMARRLSEGDAEYISAKEWTRERLALMKCAKCGRSEDSIDAFKKCVRCSTTYYCSKECQKMDWKTHKKVCKATK